MTALILDAGALVALERGDHSVHKDIQTALRTGKPIRTNANVIAQVWRNGARQARLAKVLKKVTVEPITSEDGYRAGELMGATRTKDVVDATIALLAKSGDRALYQRPRRPHEALWGDRFQGRSGRLLTRGHDGGDAPDSGAWPPSCPEKSLAREMNYLFTVLQHFGVQ